MQAQAKDYINGMAGGMAAGCCKDMNAMTRTTLTRVSPLPIQVMEHYRQEAKRQRAQAMHALPRTLWRKLASALGNDRPASPPTGGRLKTS